MLYLQRYEVNKLWVTSLWPSTLHGAFNAYVFAQGPTIPSTLLFKGVFKAL